MKNIQEAINYLVPIDLLTEVSTMYSKPKHIELANRFIHIFCKRLVTEGHYTPFSCFQNIHYTVFQENKLNSKIARKIKFEIIDKLFETTNWKVGVRSKGYRIKKKFLYGGLAEYMITLPKQKHQIRLISNPSVRPIDPQSYDILEAMDLEKCTILNTNLIDDIRDAANVKIENSFYLYPQSNNRTKLRIYSKSKLRHSANGKSNYTTHATNRIESILEIEKLLVFNRKKYQLVFKNSQKINLTKDRTGNRLHHNVLGISSEIVKHITLENESLSEIDMKNCHYSLFNNVIINPTHNLYKYINECMKGHLNTINRSIGDRLKCAINSRKDILDNSAPEKKVQLIRDSSKELDNYKDLYLFCELSFCGLLYEGLAFLFWGEISKKNRVRAKITLMEVFYGESTRDANGSDKQNLSKLKALFKEHFPTVCKITDAIKIHTQENWDEVKSGILLQGVANSVENKIDQGKVSARRAKYQASKSVLPVLLQNVESDLFLNHLLVQLRQEGFTVLSKHDSILVKESDKEIVFKRVQEILNNSFVKNRFSLKCA